MPVEEPVLNVFAPIERTKCDNWKLKTGNRGDLRSHPGKVQAVKSRFQSLSGKLRDSGRQY
jgi:hypothetical protein